MTRLSVVRTRLAATTAGRVEEPGRRFRRPPPAGLPDGWQEWSAVVVAHRRIAEAFLVAVPADSAGRFRGRGVVI